MERLASSRSSFVVVCVSWKNKDELQFDMQLLLLRYKPRGMQQLPSFWCQLVVGEE